MENKDEELNKIRQGTSEAKIRRTKGINGISVAPMDFSASNLLTAWEEFEINFNILMVAEDMENEAEYRKVAIFLRYLGSEGVRVFRSMELNMKAITLEQLTTKFRSYFSKKKNTTIERFNFFTHSQGDQSMQKSVTSLKI